MLGDKDKAEPLDAAALVARLQGGATPLHDFHESPHFADAVTEVFDALAALVHLGEAPPALASVLSRRVLPLILVELRRPSALSPAMNENKIPLQQQASVFVSEAERNASLRHTAAAIVYCLVYLFQAQAKAQVSEPWTPRADTAASLWLLRCLCDSSCAFSCVAAQALRSSLHEDLRALRVKARDAHAGAAPHALSPASSSAAALLAETLVPSPLIQPLSSSLAADLAATCVGAGDKDDDLDDAAAAASAAASVAVLVADISVAKAARLAAMRGALELTQPRAAQSPDELALLSLALARLLGGLPQSKTSAGGDRVAERWRRRGCLFWGTPRWLCLAARRGTRPRRRRKWL